MSDIVLKNSENLPKLNPFEMFRNIEQDNLEKEQGYTLYAQSAKENGTTLSTEYWSFNGQDVQKAFMENANIVSDLETDLKSAIFENKDDRIKAKIQNELRKYKRALIFKGLGKQEFADEKTGELKIANVMYFYDKVAKKTISMGQARLLVEFQNIIKLVGGDAKSLVGNSFWVIYTGRVQNKNNQKMSDTFEIVAFDYAE